MRFSVNKLYLSLLSAGIYILLYLYILPDILILRSDDFGYLQSFLSSLKQNRLVTSNFLEPYSYFSTIVSIGLFKITGNLYVSTFGSVAFFALVNFYLILYMLISRFNLKISILTALFLSTFPVYLNISADMTGIMATWALFLAAVILFQRGKYFWYAIFTMLAISNRQSSIVLLVFPLYDLIKIYISRKRIDLQFIYLIFFITGMSFFIFLKSPLTAAARISYELNLKSFEVLFSPAKLFSIITGLFSFIFIFTALITVLSPYQLKPNFRNNLKFFHLPVAAGILLLIQFLFSGDFIRFQTPLFNEMKYGTIYLKILFFLSFFFFLSVWFFPWSKLRISSFAVTGLFYILMISLRVIWYDYYLWEIVILGLFYLLSNKNIFPAETKSPGKKLNYIIPVILLLFNIIYSIYFKIYLDKNALSLFVHEKLLRQNKITVTDISDAPFGYIGWKLFNLI